MGVHRLLCQYVHALVTNDVCVVDHLLEMQERSCNDICVGMEIALCRCAVEFAKFVQAGQHFQHVLDGQGTMLAQVQILLVYLEDCVAELPSIRLPDGNIHV